MKKVLKIGGLVLGLIVLVVVIFAWHTFSKMMATETIAFDPQLTIVLGGGGNSIVLTSEDGKQGLVVEKITEDGRRFRYNGHQYALPS